VDASIIPGPVARSAAQVPPHPRMGTAWAEGWARRDYLEIGAYETAAGSARGHARNVLKEWGLTELIDAAELVVSELVTNAVLETQKVQWPAGQPPVRMWLLANGNQDLVILVWDATTGAPVPRNAGPSDESGRGLMIVRAFSAAIDHYLPPREYGGKAVWAQLPKRDE
jgi:anti-sigma regulatory factor (Ser/Thr protein kinase)